MLTSARSWIVVLVLSLLWQLLAGPAQQDINLLLTPDRPSNVLLLTAHPDDECMFFAPTILALTNHRNDEIHGNIRNSYEHGQTYSLCLSSGDADGLGELRKKELRDSLDVLGVPLGRSWVFDEPCVTLPTLLIQILCTQATQIQR